MGRYRITRGPIRIRNCDYIDMFVDLEDESVDLVASDPPYGINFQSNMKKTKKNRVLAGDAESFSYRDFALESMRVLKPNTALFAFTRWDVYPQHFQEIKDAGFHMVAPLIGIKPAAGIGDLKGSFQTVDDWVIFAHKGRFVFRETKLVRGGAGWLTRHPTVWYGKQYPPSSQNTGGTKHCRTRLVDSKPSENAYHPTMKDQRFMAWLILMSTDPDGLVVDPFTGSGTTAAACAQTGRRFVGSELDRQYCLTARDRVLGKSGLWLP